VGQEQGGSEVTYEVRLVVAGEDGAGEASEIEVSHVAVSAQAAREWVLSHATITKVVRKAVN
jgi:hypothetical protein